MVLKICDFSSLFVIGQDSLGGGEQSLGLLWNLKMDNSVQVMVSYGFCHKFVHDRCLGTKTFLQKKDFQTNHGTTKDIIHVCYRLR